MNTGSECRLVDDISRDALQELELTDLTIDHVLLDAPGTSLLVFTSVGCASCRVARRELPAMPLAVDRLCWVDAGDNGGAVQRYEVFHLPAIFVVRDGEFHGPLQARLLAGEINHRLVEALRREPDELP
ncbi:thioredoxin [Pseudomonas silvicola]|uniref:thioredoxin n=1 Tax=Pseudomonas sp. RIT-To-2 TaxID=3462541 RepID=UPI00227C8961|nr:thioredoxin [Pseudomonas silvicola]